MEEIARTISFEDRDVFENPVWDCFQSIFGNNDAFIDYDWMYSIISPTIIIDKS